MVIQDNIRRATLVSEELIPMSCPEQTEGLKRTKSRLKKSVIFGCQLNFALTSWPSFINVLLATLILLLKFNNQASSQPFERFSPIHSFRSGDAAGEDDENELSKTISPTTLSSLSLLSTTNASPSPSQSQSSSPANQLDQKLFTSDHIVGSVTAATVVNSSGKQRQQSERSVLQQPVSGQWKPTQSNKAKKSTHDAQTRVNGFEFGDQTEPSEQHQSRHAAFMISDRYANATGNWSVASQLVETNDTGDKYERLQGNQTLATNQLGGLHSLLLTSVEDQRQNASFLKANGDDDGVVRATNFFAKATNESSESGIGQKLESFETTKERIKHKQRTKFNDNETGSASSELTTASFHLLQNGSFGANQPESGDKMVAYISREPLNKGASELNSALAYTNSPSQNQFKSPSVLSALQTNATNNQLEFYPTKLAGSLPSFEVMEHIRKTLVERISKNAQLMAQNSLDYSDFVGNFASLSNRLSNSNEQAQNNQQAQQSPELLHKPERFIGFTLPPDHYQSLDATNVAQPANEDGGFAGSGPFELEQLQATASNMRDDKIVSSFSQQNQQDQLNYQQQNSLDPIDTATSTTNSALAADGVAKLQKTSAPQSGPLTSTTLASLNGHQHRQRQQLQASNSLSNEPVGSDDFLAGSDYDSPDSDSGEQASSKYHSSNNRDVDDENGGDASASGEDDGGERHGSPEQQPKALDNGAYSPPLLTMKQNLQENHNSSNNNPVATINIVATKSAQIKSGAEAQNVSTSKAAVAVGQRPLQVQRTNSSHPSNELLVGPFRSEADAPATITLAGVIYQKSGASSALIRTASPVSGSFRVRDQRGERNHNSGRGISTAVQPAVSSSSANRLQSATMLSHDHKQPANFNQPTPKPDWPSGTLLQSIFSSQQQQPQTIYLGANSMAAQAPQDSISNQLMAGNQIDFSNSGSSYQPASSSGSLMRFSQFPSSSLLANLAGLSSTGQSARGNTNELSLSGSSANTKSVSLGQLDGSALDLQTKTVQSSQTGKGLFIAASDLLTQESPSVRLPEHHFATSSEPMTTSTSSQSTSSRPTANQLRHRLPNGSLIWTLNKGSEPSVQATAPPAVVSSAQYFGNLLQASVTTSNDGSAPNAAASSPDSLDSGESSSAANQLMSESKYHHDEHHKSPPLVIVQKDVKPVKYHLLRAYLKLRRLLRPFEATYVFPSDHNSRATGVGNMNSGTLTSTTNAAEPYLGRRHQKALMSLRSGRLLGWPWRAHFSELKPRINQATGFK